MPIRVTDNVVITQEIFHSMHKKKGKSGFMIVKVDLEKAYDRLRCDFLIDTLKEMNCYCLLIIAYMCFTHHLDKRNIHNSRAIELSRISGFCFTSDLGKYLGVPMLHGKKKKETYAYLLEKTQHRLSNWMTNSLSFTCRCTLAKAVVTALPIYTMQIVLLPKQLRWGLITNPYALWVHVHRIKYGYIDQFIPSVHCIDHGFEEEDGLLEMRGRSGFGGIVSYLQGLLLCILLGKIHLVMKSNFVWGITFLLSDSGILEYFNRLFPVGSFEKLWKSFLLIMFYKALTLNRNFSIKITYRLLRGDDNVRAHEIWRKIWDKDIHPHDSCFLWKVVHNDNFTNVFRQSQGLCDNVAILRKPYLELRTSKLDNIGSIGKIRKPGKAKLLCQFKVQDCKLYFQSHGRRDYDSRAKGLCACQIALLKYFSQFSNVFLLRWVD
ncbi:putative ribonuclease H protein, partial [Mucuna pruriens]